MCLATPPCSPWCFEFIYLLVSPVKDTCSPGKMNPKTPPPTTLLAPILIHPDRQHDRILGTTYYDNSLRLSNTSANNNLSFTVIAFHNRSLSAPSHFP